MGPTGDLKIRAAVHAGQATERDGDFFGPPVNRVARINGAAHPGQVVVSDIAYRLMAAPSGRDLGKHQLRDLGEPVQLWQLDDGEHPPLQSLRPDLHNLPVQRTEFVGRDTELDDLTDLLQSSRLVTITGVGGCGKTRLTVELAARNIDAFEGGAWFADLRPAADRDQIIQEIAAAVGLVAASDIVTNTVLFDALVEYAQSQPTLVILDNCEHIIDEAADIAEDLLEQAPKLVLLATSREALAVEGERVWRIPSLAVESGDARALFRDRALAANSQSAEVLDDSELIDEICSRLDGIPLAIELAAARVAHMTLRELNDRLDERFSLLSGGRRARRQRQQTLQAMMDWSWDLLDEDEQTMLAEFSVFRGGFDHAAVAAVCVEPTLGTHFDVLTGLIDRSLVSAMPGQMDLTRYQLLETVRLYGLDRLVAAGTLEDVRDRHVEWVRSFNSCRVTGGNNSFAETRHALANVDNVFAALKWLSRSNDVSAIAELASGTVVALWMEKSVDGRRWLSPELLADETIPLDIRIAAHCAATGANVFGGDYEAAAEISEASLALIDSGEVAISGGWLAQTHRWAAALAVGRGNFEEAEGHLETAGEIPGGSEMRDTFDAVSRALLALGGKDFLGASQVCPVESALFEWCDIPGVNTRGMLGAYALSRLGRHQPAVEIVDAMLVVGTHRRLPIASGLAISAEIYRNGGRVQDGFDLMSRPPRLAVGPAMDHWRLGRALLFAGHFLPTDPTLAGHLIGSVKAVSAIILAIWRREIIDEIQAATGRAEELLDAGRLAGEDAVIAQAHERLLSDGLQP